VQAFVTQQRAASEAGEVLTNPSIDAGADGAGALGAGHHLGVTVENLGDGRSARRFAIVGALLCVIGFVMPAVRLWETEPPAYWGDEPKVHGYYRFSWDLWHEGHGLALAWPLVAAVLALVAALAPRLPAVWRFGLIAVAGLGGLALSLGQLGGYGMAPTETRTIAMFALVLAGASLWARLLWPASVPVRRALIAAAALLWIGMLIPVQDVAKLLPFDYSANADVIDLDLASRHMPLVAIAKGVDKRLSAMLFVALFLLVPLVALPAAAALAWKQPRGIWDKAGLGLRPLAWLLTFYVPLLYGLMAFSATGWDDELSKSALIGRMRLTVLVAPFFVWAQLGMLGVIASGRKRAA
jgi:hypothetical protein